MTQHQQRARAGENPWDVAAEMIEGQDASAVLPVRIKRKRTKGWRMPEGAVSVCRPGKWGNPFAVQFDPALKWCVHVNRSLECAFATKELAAEYAVALFRCALLEPQTIPRRLHILKCGLEDARALRGKSLACWCELGQPCHADVLLEIANEPTEEIHHGYAGAIPMRRVGKKAAGNVLDGRTHREWPTPNLAAPAASETRGPTP